MDCIFCRIVAGQIPCFKVFEDEATLAFMDINPLAEGHLLVIPKAHCANLWEADESTLSAVMATARRVGRAMRSALGLDSLNVVQANGPHAAQSVPHLHLHLIPRRAGDGLGMDWPLDGGDMDALKVTGERIADAVQ